MYFILNPSVWPAFIRHLRRSHSSSPPTLMLAGCVLIALVQAVQLWLGPFSLVLLVAVSWVTLLLATVVSLTIVRDCVRRLMRYRSLAWSRQRWWFELARLALLVGTIAQCCFMSIAFLELRFNLGWSASAMPLWRLAFTCAAIFVVACTCGMALSRLNRRPRAGRAYECVAFFYQFCLAGMATCAMGIIGLQIRAPEVMLFGLAAGCALMAVGIHWNNKRLHKIA